MRAEFLEGFSLESSQIENNQDLINLGKELKNIPKSYFIKCLTLNKDNYLEAFGEKLLLTKTRYGLTFKLGESFISGGPLKAIGMFLIPIANKAVSLGDWIDYHVPYGKGTIVVSQNKNNFSITIHLVETRQKLYESKYLDSYKETKSTKKALRFNESDSAMTDDWIIESIEALREYLSVASDEVLENLRDLRDDLDIIL